jgi:hypothetical protein
MASSVPWITSTGHRIRRHSSRNGLLVELIAGFGGNECLRRCVQAPADAVLGGLGRVRFGEHLGEEELEEAAVVAQPVVAVVLRPALISAELLVPALRRAVHWCCGERQVWGVEDGSGHQVRVPGCQQQRALRAERQRHDHRVPGPGGIHHRQCVGGELALVAAGLRAAGAAVAPAVEGDDPAVPGQVGDLHLPVPRMDDRPRRQEDDGRLAGPVDLVVELDPAAPGVAVTDWLAGAHRWSFLAALAPPQAA